MFALTEVWIIDAKTNGDEWKAMNERIAEKSDHWETLVNCESELHIWFFLWNQILYIPLLSLN